MYWDWSPYYYADEVEGTYTKNAAGDVYTLYIPGSSLAVGTATFQFMEEAEVENVEVIFTRGITLGGYQLGGSSGWFSPPFDESDIIY